MTKNNQISDTDHVFLHDEVIAWWKDVPATPGIGTLARSYESMHVDEEWSIRDCRSYTWWAHRLAQRVWVDPPRERYGLAVYRIHVQTDLIRNVEETPELYKLLNTLNSWPSFYAYVYEPEERKVRLHSTICAHRNNTEWITTELMVAQGLQLGDADCLVKRIASMVPGSEPDVTTHPDNGYREVQHDLASLVTEYFIPQGQASSPRTADDLGWVVENLYRHFMATSGATELTAEFPYTDEEPIFAGIEGGQQDVMTSLLLVGTDQSHPYLGSGVIMNLLLPPVFEEEWGIRLAAHLNLRETTEWTKANMLGAWSWSASTQNGLSFRTFIPTAAYHSMLLSTLCLNDAVRSAWAAGVLPIMQVPAPTGQIYTAAEAVTVH